MARFEVLRIVSLALAVLSATAGSARASVITAGDVDPGGTAIQPDPWAVGGPLKVGDSGIGTLNVEAGGVVSNSHGYIGYESDSTGEATVTGAGSQWNNSGALFVGDSGSGTLNVEANGVVSNDWGYIGNESGSTGEATVTGADSQWTNSSHLYVGYSGDGTLTVKAGGVVSNTVGYIGADSGSTSEATVTGADSQWTNSSHLLCGLQWLRHAEHRVGGRGIQYERLHRF